KLEAGVPVGGWPEVFAGVVTAAQLIVRRAFLGIGEHGVSLVHVLHPRFGVSLLRNVRVILARELAEGLLDVLLLGIARHAERLVVILEFQAGSPRRHSREACPRVFESGDGNPATFERHWIPHVRGDDDRIMRTGVTSL